MMVKRISIYLIGLAINALGIAFIIHSTVGAGAWDTVAIGLHHYVGLTIGICSVITQVLVVIATKVIDGKRLQYGAIIAITIRSAFLDAWTYLVFNHLHRAVTWEIQWLYFILGLISMGIGIGIYVEAHFPKSPVDGLMMALHHRFNWSINVSRIICECTGVILGFILSGPVGLGTLILTFLLGKVIQFTNGKMKTLLDNKTVTGTELMPQKF